MYAPDPCPKNRRKNGDRNVKQRDRNMGTKDGMLKRVGEIEP